MDRCLSGFQTIVIIPVMVQIVITDVDVKTRDALNDLAQRHGRSLEDEVRAILDAAITPRRRIDWSKVATVSTGHTGHVTRDEVNATYDSP